MRRTTAEAGFTERFTSLIQALIGNEMVKNKNQLAESIGTYCHVLKRVEDGKQELTLFQCQQLKKNYHVSLDWLVNGEGKMFTGECNLPQKDEVAIFIHNFRMAGGFHKKSKEGIIKLFTQGYCYYFALMLVHRFPNWEGYDSRICYDVLHGHFVANIGKKCYDITGEVDLIGRKLIGWDEFEAYDSEQYKRIVNDCINK